MSHSHGTSASSADSSTSSNTGMNMVFFNGMSSPLYCEQWTPNSSGTYAGTCIFLILIAVVFRSLFAVKVFLERRWLDEARNRRYVAVKGMSTEGQMVAENPAAKEAILTVRGVEESVRVVKTGARGAQPFRLS